MLNNYSYICNIQVFGNSLKGGGVGENKDEGGLIIYCRQETNQVRTSETNQVRTSESISKLYRVIHI